MQQPTARSLILDLLSTVRRGAVPVRSLVRAAGVFGIGSNPVRVALARLRASGLVESDRRGFYRLGERADAVQQQVASWRRLGERTRDWGGSWLAVHTGPLGRSQRPALRRRERALAFLGFRTLEPGLSVRPDNLADDVAATRERLYGLGLESDALVARLDDLGSPREEQARTLWDSEALRRDYRTLTVELALSAERLSELPRERAMVESFLLGGQAIRRLVYDPLLPDQIAPHQDRNGLVAQMLVYDRLGRESWTGVLEIADERAPADVRGLDAVDALAAQGA